MMSKIEFDQAISQLGRYGSPGNERLVIRQGILTTKSRGNFLERIIQFFYKPKNERIQTVAAFALKFFKDNERHIRDPQTLKLLLPTLQKTKYGSKLETLINRIDQREIDQSTHIDAKSLDSVEDSIEDTEDSIEDTEDSIEVAVEYIFSEDNYKILLDELEQEYDIVLKDRLISYLSIEVSKIDLTRGLEILNNTYHFLERRHALNQIAKKLMKTDFTRALEVANSDQHSIDSEIEMIVAESKFDLNSAIEKAKQMTFYNSSDRCLCKVAQKLAKTNLPRALELARSLNEDFYKCMAIRFVATGYAKVDCSIALEILNTTDRNYRSTLYDMALSNISIEQAKEDPFGALETINRVEDSYDRNTGLAKIAVELAKIDIIKALEAARAIDSEDWSFEMIKLVAAEQAKNDVLGALETAKSIPDEMRRIDAINHLVVIRAETDSLEILETIESFDNECERQEALAWFATFEARHNADNALERFRNIEATGLVSRERLDRPFGKIVSEIAKSDVQRSKTLATEITTTYIREQTLCKIAIEQAKTDFTEALHTIRNVKINQYLIDVFKAITNVILKPSEN